MAGVPRVIQFFFSQDGDGVTKISILYPNAKGTRFDFAYYLEKHMPLAIRLMGEAPGYQGVSVERGVAGGAPGSDPEYAAMCHFLFDSAQDFAAAFAVHGRN
jgi:uncharacterized protein (TIGR02118 family)